LRQVAGKGGRRLKMEKNPVIDGEKKGGGNANRNGQEVAVRGRGGWREGREKYFNRAGIYVTSRKQCESCFAGCTD